MKYRAVSRSYSSAALNSFAAFLRGLHALEWFEVEEDQGGKESWSDAGLFNPTAHVTFL